jgi:actin-related protein 3
LTTQPVGPGNLAPDFVIPTAIATKSNSGASNRPAVPSKPGALSSSSSNLASKRGIEDLDFYIGYEAIEHSKTYALDYPIKHGVIENWDQMERCALAVPPFSCLTPFWTVWEQCIFKYMRAEPEDHHFLLVRYPNLRAFDR